MIRVMVDTNVLVSPLISPTGNEALILLAVRQVLVKPAFSREIVQEYAEVLARPKFAFPRDKIKALIAMLRDKGEEVRDPEPPDSRLPDPADNKFLGCAKVRRSRFHRDRQQATFSSACVRRHPRRERRRVARPRYPRNLNLNVPATLALGISGCRELLSATGSYQTRREWGQIRISKGARPD